MFPICYNPATHQHDDDSTLRNLRDALSLSSDDLASFCQRMDPNGSFLYDECASPRMFVTIGPFSGMVSDETSEDIGTEDDNYTPSEYWASSIRGEWVYPPVPVEDLRAIVTEWIAEY